MNIARALYFNADIVLLDDPLSAVDAHVGKHLFDRAICGALGSKTRVLVTHALHFLPSVDYVICIDKGKITQQGTYAELLADREGAFSTLVREFGGGKEKEVEEKSEVVEDVEEEEEEKKEKKVVKKGKGLMQEEERATGAVSAAGESNFYRRGEWY